ncbi:hypothetical protein J7I93_04495 [Bacillus sp. ISL-47]|nr:hypothetical protein [Bacillus sp. ISL-47]MBT2687438.1 hypothetical protein [Bacillus sp. ISL-47]MBT2707100.1 hypothetical protein [Pseudomonas sp. ISL-84]
MTKEQESFLQILLDAYVKGESGEDISKKAFIVELEEKLRFLFGIKS